MLEAAFWGFVGGFALLVGAFIGMRFTTPARTIGLIMGFGAGVLISSVAFELTEEAFNVGGEDAVAIGLAVGAITFFVGDWLVDSRGGDRRKRSSGQSPAGEDNNSSSALVIGSLLDGIPESIAIGVSLLAGGGVSVAMVIAVFLSNIPESLSAVTGMKAAGRSKRYVYGLWTTVAIVSAGASALGYGMLGNASPNLIAAIQAFAAGAILTMLADTMMPEAFEHGGKTVGLVTVLGFSLAFYLSTLE